MTPTATYIAEENCLQELPKRERPDATKILGGAPTGVDYEVMDELMDEYYAHLASLRKIPCDPSCKGLWADGQKLVEKLDYQVANRVTPPKLLAFPLVPVNSEDENWREMLQTVFDHHVSGYDANMDYNRAIAELKSKYLPLTKR